MASTLIAVESGPQPVLGISGELLPMGSAIELGYFDQATIYDLFAGEWTPIIGVDAPAANRTIAPIFVGSGGNDPTSFVWYRAFFEGIDALPPIESPLALRFHDHPNTKDSTFVNTVSHPSWWFRAPRSPSPSFVAINLDETNLAWESGPDGAFLTVLRGPGNHAANPTILRRASTAFSAFRRSLRK